MSDEERKVKKGQKRILVFFIFIAVLIFLNPFSISLYINNYYLNHFEKSLNSIPIPSNTRVVKLSSSVGLNSAYKFGEEASNGDHCDFLAFKVLETSLSEKEVTEFYKNRSVKAAKGNGIVQIVIKDFKEASNGNNSFRIQVYDPDHSAMLDIRCG
ncbi:hypothetical protein [Paenibacillus sp. R14(2021)]|uniref:hypothetical protein n=1 Tax=Paenibacillus sp. R14(2021) TaxID=2859228 RepID=UPI001C611E53|nr:hypothetical protein [Paenibacillus sp. R14(2021)]